MTHSECFDEYCCQAGWLEPALFFVTPAYSRADGSAAAHVVNFLQNFW